MRTLFIAAVGLSLSLGLAAVANADPPDDATKPAAKGSMWWPPNWFAGRSSAKADDRKPTAKEENKVSPAVEAARLTREREAAAYLRRQMVCDKLIEIADLTKDEALRRKAEVLAERAYTLYQQRTAAGPASDLDGQAKLLDASQQRGTSLLPTGNPVWPGAGQANLRRDY